jgi:hypothetical protein
MSEYRDEMFKKFKDWVVKNKDDKKLLIKVLGVAYTPVVNTVLGLERPRPQILDTLEEFKGLSDSEITFLAFKIYMSENIKTKGDPNVTEGLNYFEDVKGYYNLISYDWQTDSDGVEVI